MARRAKIVATLGPATDPPGVLESLIAAGLDVARLNFSHVEDEETPLRRIAAVREVAAKLGRVVAVLADLPGPKLRVKIPSARMIVAGETAHFPLEGVEPREHDIPITDPEVLTDLKPGDRMLIDDGKLQLRVVGVADGRLTAEVTVGGPLKENKGLNLPDTVVSIPSVTERDHFALGICAKTEIDWLAMSFVRGPASADELRAVARTFGLGGVPIVAKIERPEAVGRAAEIVVAFDGVMVARGDLGVELPFETLPPIQKAIIAAARLAGKPVITATEMLESMTKNPRPTRAEVSDVANAVFDGTDAVMLSAETSVGEYPCEAVRTMANIAEEAERAMRQKEGSYRPGGNFQPGDTIEDSLALAACQLAGEVAAAAIVTPSVSGRTARMLARYRPAARIVAPVPNEAVLRQLALVWGVEPVLMGPLKPGDGRMTASIRVALKAGVVRVGDRAVVFAGHPIEGESRMPTLRVVKVGEGGASVEP
jgi:pyruvate kinase